MTENQFICDFAWTQLYNTPSGTVTPCCVYGEPIKKEDGTPFLLQKDSVKDIFKSEYLKKLRKSFLKGEKPKQCEFCWKQEDLGYESRRIQNNNYNKFLNIDIDYNLELDYPTEYELILSNSCNLKCRSCNPVLSTQWMKEERGYSKEDSEILDLPKVDLSNVQVGNKESKFIKEISDWAPHIRKIQTLGGEPLYGNTWKYVINYLIQNNYSKNITISIATNGTLYEEEFITSLCDNFSNVTIGLSIDGKGDVFEYLRKNGIWKDVDLNLKNYQTNFSTYTNYEHYFRFTVSWINAISIVDFDKYVKGNNKFSPIDYGILFEPNHMAIWNIPSFYKQKIKNKLLSHDFEKNESNINSIIDFMYSKQPSDDEIKNNFIKFKIIDKYRSEDTLNLIKNIDHELYNFFIS